MLSEHTVLDQVIKQQFIRKLNQLRFVLVSYVGLEVVQIFYEQLSVRHTGHCSLDGDNSISEQLLYLVLGPLCDILQVASFAGIYWRPAITKRSSSLGMKSSKPRS